MHRRPVAKSKSHNAFKRRVSKTAALNVANVRRGGIRL